MGLKGLLKLLDQLEVDRFCPLHVAFHRWQLSFRKYFLIMSRKCFDDTQKSPQEANWHPLWQSYFRNLHVLLTCPFHSPLDLLGLFGPAFAEVVFSGSFKVVKLKLPKIFLGQKRQRCFNQKVSRSRRIG